MSVNYTDDLMLDNLQHMQSSGLPCVLLVTHALGGGVERHIQELLCALRQRAHVCVLRPHVHASQVLLSVPMYQCIEGLWQQQSVVRLAFKWPLQAEQLHDWLQALGVTRVHVHHVIGFAESFWRRLHELSLPLDLTLHDHSILTGNPSLLDSEGCFDPSWIDQGLDALPLGDARVAQILQALAMHAQRVIVPSQSLAAVIGQLLPSLRTLVRCHPERELLGAYPPVRPMQITLEKPFKVLCLGMLGIEKGAYALAQTAALAAQQQLNIEFILLGACHVSLPPEVRCLGLYQDADLPNLIADVNPNILWLPAQCPETWSYTLSAGLYAGLPVLASDLGALPERLKGRPYTQMLKHSSTAREWLAAIQLFRDCLLDVTTANEQLWRQQECPPFYLNQPQLSEDPQICLMASYVQRSLTRSPSIKCLPLGFSAAQALARRSAGRWRVRLLGLLYMLARWPVMDKLIRCVPYRWQRRLKRAISRAPLDSRIIRK